MAKQTGYLWAVVQEWLDSNWNPPSQNKLAARLGTSASALSDYKYAIHMPPPAFLERLASEIQVPYERVLDAALRDRGYRRHDTKEVVGNAEHPAPRSDANRWIELERLVARAAAAAERPSGSQDADTGDLARALAALREMVAPKQDEREEAPSDTA